MIGKSSGERSRKMAWKGKGPTRKPLLKAVSGATSINPVGEVMSNAQRSRAKLRNWQLARQSVSTGKEVEDETLPRNYSPSVDRCL